MSRFTRAFDALMPSRLVIAGTAFAAFLLCLLANARPLLESYGLDSSSQYLGQSASQRFLHFLSTLDSFRLTASIVTFLVWALVGLVCLGIVQSLLNLRRSLQEEHDFTSKGYVHPQNFTARTFYNQIVWSIVRTIVSAGLCLGTLLLLLGGLVPLARLYQSPTIETLDIINAIFAVFGFMLVWAGCVLVYIAVRGFILRNRLTTL